MSLFWPLADEIDTLPLLHALHWLGAEPLLPRMQGRGRPLVFHRWIPELELVDGPFQVREPPPHLPPLLPEIVLAPLLAFDRSGHRLGYGAGFYDMTFAAIAAAGGSPLRAGYCFAGQEVDARAGRRYRRPARSGRHRGRLPAASPRRKAEPMRILFVGDVVGRSGPCRASGRAAQAARGAGAATRSSSTRENAAGGYGLTAAIAAEFLDAGADVLTMGNHVWDQRELIGHIDREPRIVRPLNLAPGTPGRGVAEIRTARGQRVLVLQVLGRLFMALADDPFRALDAELAASRAGRHRAGDRRRRPCRGHQREAGAGASPGRPGLAGRRHPHPRADGRPSGPRRAAPATSPTSA